MADIRRLRVLNAIDALDEGYAALGTMTAILDGVSCIADVLENNGELNRLNELVLAADEARDNGWLKQRAWQIGFDEPPYW